ncbi:MAG TPA: alpha/beta hydrolase [Rhizomicrobium sp.]|nr:alpha/beta hydrolase [Rhizomicrobium sp.]
MRPKPAATADVAELRRQYAYLAEQFGPVPRTVTFDPAAIGPIKGEWVRAASAPQTRMILYFHGGGFVGGSPEMHRSVVGQLCEAAETNAFSLAYRLAPEYAFPAAVRDGIDAYRHLIARGHPARSIVLAGDAAGGGLAFAVALAIRNAGLDMPAGIIAMSPWADMALTGWSMLQNEKNDAALSWALLFISARNYLRKTLPTDPYASPVYADFKDFPPIMVHAGALEILRDDASRLGEKAAAAGVPVSVEIYDGMQHVFQANPYVPEAKVSLGRFASFIKARTRDAAVTARSETQADSTS